MINTDFTTDSLEPKIYVVCLASYGAGRTHAAWIDANQTAEEMQAEINTLLSKSPVKGAMGWAIHGCSGFGPICLSKNTGLDSIAAMSAIIEEHGNFGAEIIAYNGDNPECAIEALKNYCGAYKNKADFAEHRMRKVCDIPVFLRIYINYAVYASHIFMYDFYDIEIDGKCHVFCKK